MRTSSADVMEQASQQPPPTLVEWMAHKADELAGRIKQLENKLEQPHIKVLYYKTVIRVAEQELGIAIEKSRRGPVRYQAIQLVLRHKPKGRCRRGPGIT